MGKRCFKTDVQRRLAEVLDKLGFDCDYVVNDEVFIIKDQDYLVYETIEPDRETYKHFYEENRILRIYADGNIIHNEDDEVRIKLCKCCKKFFISLKPIHQPLHFMCPYCGKDKVKSLANNSRIPDWYGKEIIKLIDKDEAMIHLMSCPPTEHDKIKRLIDKLSGKVDFIRVTEEIIHKIKALESKYPNMSEVINYILDCFQTSLLKENREISFKPIILVGSPGCGKTSFATELCQILMGRKAIKIDLGNEIANFTITGSDPTYTKARCGMIVEALLATDTQPSIKNPVIHFDELDKIKGNDAHTIETAFFSILEKGTARHFFDNYIGVNVDASGINYIFTANSLESTPAPILNRAHIFNIPDYTHEQLKNNVIDNFYKNWIRINNMEADYLPRVLSDFIKEKILEECHDDPRSIEDAISLVFSRTINEDARTQHKIALFSPEELYLGWEKYRGAKAISKSEWELPEGFLGKKKERSDTYNMAICAENW